MAKSKFTQNSINAWNDTWKKSSLPNSLGAIGSGITGIADAAMSNSKIDDTSDEEAEISNTSSTQFGSGSYDNLLSSFSTMDMAKSNYRARDIRGLSTGQMFGNTLKGVGSGAMAGAQIGGPWGAIIGGAAGLLGGLGGIFAGNKKARDKADELNLEAKRANEQYLANFENAASNTHNTMFNNSLLNMAARGGKLYIQPKRVFNDGGLIHHHGGIFSNGITFIGNGGTHEQNPFEGVQIGVDAKGVPNMVEEGEVIWQDYVFSNRLKPTKEFKDKYKIKGDTFADAANEMQKESEERVNDAISKRGLNDSMMKLMLEQEKVRSISKSSTPNNMFDRGGKKTNKSKSDTLDTSNMMNSMLEHDYYVNQLGYRSVEEGKRIERESKTQKAIEDITGASAPLTLEDVFSVFKKDKKYKTGRNKKTKFNDGGGLNVPFMHNGKTITNEEFLKLLNSGEAQVDYKYFTNPKAPSLREAVGKTTIAPLPKVSVTNKLKEALDLETKRALTPPVSTIKTLSYDTNSSNESDTPASRNSWLRYAPALGSAMGVFSDLLGITNKPDYSNTKLIQDATDRIKPISYTPIGTYLSYNPFDTNFYSSRLAEQTGATRRAITNQAINPGAAMAGLLVADYNAQTQLGGLFRQAEEYNQAQREKVAGFNRQTDAMKAEMAMKAAIANQSADELRLKSAMTQAQMREQADATASAAKSANITNFFDNLGAIGKENFIMDMLERNPALLYNWLDEYKGKAACGGKINRRRRK